MPVFSGPALCAAALRAAGAEGLPALHAGEGACDAGSGLAVEGNVLPFPSREFGPAALSAVRDDQAGARVTAVCDRPQTPAFRIETRAGAGSGSSVSTPRSVGPGLPAADPCGPDPLLHAAVR